jgi:integrative and conjugative element protein (TIGR02256 family)
MIAMIEDAYRWTPVETGGILMGSPSDSDGPAEVSWVVGGGPEAERTQTSFDPDQWWQEEQVSIIYELSGRRATYLGDWHSHPNGRPELSWRDKNVARLIASDPAARCESPIMWVIGAQVGRTEWRAYRLRGRRFTNMPILLRSLPRAEVII